MKETYTINGIVFTSRDAIVDAVHKIRDKYREGEFLSQADSMFIYDLLIRHPEHEQKIGKGIKGFRAVISPFGEKAFNLIRIDDSESDFSYMKCIKGKPYSGREKFRRACREAIMPDKMEYVNQYFEKESIDGKAPCEITKKMIKKSNADVHHANIDFDDIVQNYINEKQIDPDKIEYIMGIDNHIGVEFCDKSLEADFRQYHKKHAKLAVVDRTAHSSKGIKK